MPQLASPLNVPVVADSVAPPVLEYGEMMTALHFETADERWGRVTFERLDSIKVSRGEYPPYPEPAFDPETYSWVSTVSNSAWLRERHSYEKTHYGHAYNFNGDPDEMLTEYSHYVFSFHDQFVEAIAAGIWFEVADRMLGQEEPEDAHPLVGLAHFEPTERFDHCGINCLVRRNPQPIDEIQRGAELCSQVIFEVGTEFGSSNSDWSLTYRVRDGVGRSYLRSYFGNPVATYAGIPAFSEVRPRIEQWLEEVSARRKQMGLT